MNRQEAWVAEYQDVMEFFRAGKEKHAFSIHRMREIAAQNADAMMAEFDKRFPAELAYSFGPITKRGENAGPLGMPHIPYKDERRDSAFPGVSGNPATVFGMQFKVDDSLPPGTIKAVDPDTGKTMATLTNVADPEAVAKEEIVSAINRVSKTLRKNSLLPAYYDMLELSDRIQKHGVKA